MNLNDSGPLNCQNSARLSSLSMSLYGQNTHHAVSSALTSLFLSFGKNILNVDVYSYNAILNRPFLALLDVLLKMGIVLYM